MAKRRAVKRLEHDAFSLTPVETRIISMALRGFSLDETAEALGYKSRQSIKNFRRNAYDKLGCSNTLELVAMAFQQKALQLWFCDSLEPDWMVEAARKEYPEYKRRERLRNNYA